MSVSKEVECSTSVPPIIEDCLGGEDRKVQVRIYEQEFLSLDRDEFKERLSLKESLYQCGRFGEGGLMYVAIMKENVLIGRTKYSVPLKLKLSERTETLLSNGKIESKCSFHSEDPVYTDVYNRCVLHKLKTVVIYLKGEREIDILHNIPKFLMFPCLGTFTIQLKKGDEIVDTVSIDLCFVTKNNFERMNLSVAKIFIREQYKKLSLENASEEEGSINYKQEYYEFILQKLWLNKFYTYSHDYGTQIVPIPNFDQIARLCPLNIWNGYNEDFVSYSITVKSIVDNLNKYHPDFYPDILSIVDSDLVDEKIALFDKRTFIVRVCSLKTCNIKERNVSIGLLQLETKIRYLVVDVANNRDLFSSLLEYLRREQYRLLTYSRGVFTIRPFAEVATGPFFDRILERVPDYILNLQSLTEYDSISKESPLIPFKHVRSFESSSNLRKRKFERDIIWEKREYPEITLYVSFPELQSINGQHEIFFEIYLKEREIEILKEKISKISSISKIYFDSVSKHVETKTSRFDVVLLKDLNIERLSNGDIIVVTLLKNFWERSNVNETLPYCYHNLNS